MDKPFWDISKRVEAKGSVGVIKIHGEIVSDWDDLLLDWMGVDVTRTSFPKFRAALDEVVDCTWLECHINSPGGDAITGFAIHNELRALKGVKTTAFIDAMAASAGAIIAVACDKVVMNPGSLIMVHGCSALAGYLNQADAEKVLNLLKAFDGAQSLMLQEATGQVAEVVDGWLADEQWFTAEEAIEAGLADEITGRKGQRGASSDGSRAAAHALLPKTVTALAARMRAADDNALPHPGVVANSQQRGVVMATQKVAQHPTVPTTGPPEATAVDAVVAAAVADERARVAAIVGLIPVVGIEAAQAAISGGGVCSAEEFALKHLQTMAANAPAQVAQTAQAAPEASGQSTDVAAALAGLNLALAASEGAKVTAGASDVSHTAGAYLAEAGEVPNASAARAALAADARARKGATS